MRERLYSEVTGTLTGARDRIVFFHGLMNSQGALQIPDHVDLELTRSSEASGTGGAIADHRLALAGVAVAAETVTVGSAGLTEVWTFAATRTNPYTVAVGATSTASVDNLVAAFNLDTVQNLVADAVVAGTFRVRGALIPGGTAENGVRDLTGEASTTGDAWATTSNGAGNVGGMPEWTVLARNDRRVVVRVRGMVGTDSIAFRLRCWQMHSSIRAATTALATGTDGSVVVGGVVLTSAGGTFVVSGVRVGDVLCVTEPDTTVANTRNNGAYVITAVTATTVTVNAATPFKVTQTGIDFTIGQGMFLSGTEYGAGGTSVAQVQFGLPAGTSHSAASIAVDAELPGPAIEVGEIVDGALADTTDGREKMAAGWFDAGADHANALAKFEDGFWAAAAADRAKFAAGFVTGAMLSIQPYEDIGRLGAGWIRWAANSSVGDTITIGGVVFTAVAAGAVAFQFNQAGGTAATMTSLAAAVNADSTVARALEIGGDVVALFARTAAGGNVALAESSAGVRTVVSAATMAGSTAAADRSAVIGSYTILAADVTALDPAVFNGEIAIAAIPSTGTPILLSFEVRTAAGVFRSKATIGARLLQQGANEWALLMDETGGVGVLAATDTITFMVAVNS